jgi:aminodeoxyfutalosine deaminase
MEPIESFLAKLPKVELHVHLVGSASMATVLELARRHPVWEAIEHLHAERIGHGISSMADPRLVSYLRETQLPLDVSPTSNVRTRCVASLAGHPLRAMAESGLYVTVNSDDPPMFGTTLANEYLVAASDLGFSAAELAGLAANAVRASFLDEASKEALTAEIAAVSASFG